jgi:hypothetical protein
MRIHEILTESESDPRFQQIQKAWEKHQQRQNFYGRTPEELQGDPEEIGDTWDDYKRYIKTFGKLPNKPKSYDPSKDDPNAVPLDPEKLQKPKFVPGQTDPWDTEPDLGTIG